MDHKTIRRGLQEVESEIKLPVGKIRACGGVRKRLTDRCPEIGIELTKAVKFFTRGGPESLLLWTSKSTYKLAEDLTRAGYEIAPTIVRKLLKAQGYSLKANCKKIEWDQKVRIRPCLPFPLSQ